MRFVLNVVCVNIVHAERFYIVSVNMNMNVPVVNTICCVQFGTVCASATSVEKPSLTHVTISETHMLLHHSF